MAIACGCHTASLCPHFSACIPSADVCVCARVQYIWPVLIRWFMSPCSSDSCILCMRHFMTHCSVKRTLQIVLTTHICACGHTYENLHIIAHRYCSPSVSTTQQLQEAFTVCFTSSNHCTVLCEVCALCAL